MKTIRSLALWSFCLALGVILAAPSLARAEDRFRATYTSDSHDGHRVVVALGHLAGLHMNDGHHRHRAHHRHYVSHAPRLRYAHNAYCRCRSHGVNVQRFADRWYRASVGVLRHSAPHFHRRHIPHPARRVRFYR